MWRECREWMLRTHDLGLLSEYELERRSEARTPWDAAHDAQANPLERLLVAATVANRMVPADMPALLELLHADDPGVRFWGATGLVALGAKARPATEQLLAATQDKSPEVRVLAAEALAHVGRLNDALPVLIAALQHDSAVIRLRALNVLDQLGQDARPALQAIQQAKPQGKGHVEDYVGRMVEYIPEKFPRSPVTP
jgi:HEAT repeat protein